jgi:hypothetical protein
MKLNKRSDVPRHGTRHAPRHGPLSVHDMLDDIGCHWSTTCQTTRFIIAASLGLHSQGWVLGCIRLYSDVFGGVGSILVGSLRTRRMDLFPAGLFWTGLGGIWWVFSVDFRWTRVQEWFAWSGLITARTNTWGA